MNIIPAGYLLHAAVLQTYVPQDISTVDLEDVDANGITVRFVPIIAWRIQDGGGHYPIFPIRLERLDCTRIGVPIETDPHDPDEPDRKLWLVVHPDDEFGDRLHGNSMEGLKRGLMQQIIRLHKTRSQEENEP